MPAAAPPARLRLSVTPDPSRAGWLRHARSYLRAADPVLARLIDDRPDFDPRAWMSQLPPMDLFGALLFQVTGQQLSVPATRRTLARIQALFGGRLPSPAELLGTDPGKLREAGLSWRKINTLRDLATRLSDGRLSQDMLSSLPDDELMAELTVIPGIGPWTVQGAMIIALHRETSSCPATSRCAKPSGPDISSITSRRSRRCWRSRTTWRPYRSLATSYLFAAAFEAAGPRDGQGRGDAGSRLRRHRRRTSSHL